LDTPLRLVAVDESSLLDIIMELQEDLSAPPRKRQHVGAAGFGSAPPTGRVVLHLDLDCFYCQVEQLRLNIPPDTPCAVQQWEGLIAVNYEARAKGVTRHMRAPEAQKLCPELRLVHVQTIGEGGGGGGGPLADDVPPPAGPAVPPRSARQSQKACLERYRKASLEIQSLIRNNIPPNIIMEKASIDEVYLDITPMVEHELEMMEASVQQGGEAATPFAWGSVVPGTTGLQASSPFDNRLSIGSKISARLRGLVRSELGFTVSAGISTNKLLSKLASAMHKPNQQTIILPRAVPEIMADLPLTKIGHLGGKVKSPLCLVCYSREKLSNPW